LDLCATTPPITEVIDGIARQFARHTILLVTQVYEKVSAFSLAQLQERLDWTELRVYDLDEKAGITAFFSERKLDALLTCAVQDRENDGCATI